MYIIQFIHPIDEAIRGRKLPKAIANYPYHCPWLQIIGDKCRHRRKFLLNAGNYLDQGSKVVHCNNLHLWCEAEWDTLDKPVTNAPAAGVSPQPKNEHNFHVTGAPASTPVRVTFANTDPYVFGPRFKYSNCRQFNHTLLRSLPAGSIILFGSHISDANGAWNFLLDTVFVIDDAREELPFSDDGKLTSLPQGLAGNPDITAEFINRVLNRLFSSSCSGKQVKPCGGKKTKTSCSGFTLYFGKLHQAGKGWSQPFSFVPIQLGGKPFPRMVLNSLPLPNGKNCISPACRGVNYTKVSQAELLYVWQRLAQAVQSSGYVPAWNFPE